MSDKPEEPTDWALKTNSGASATPPPVGTRPTSVPSDLGAGTDGPPDLSLQRDAQDTFRRLGAIRSTKVGILGATNSGKSYLFRAMTYRASNPARSGSLGVFLGKDPAEVYWTDPTSKEAWPMKLESFNEDYKNWVPLRPTNVTSQRWYKLLLRYRTGWFGCRRAEMSIDFLDGSGEAMQKELPEMDPVVREMFEGAYLPANVLIFCLPIWAAFLSPSMRDEHAKAKADALKGFYSILHNFKSLRERQRSRVKVQTILALTQADDQRSALSDLRSLWIDPFVKEAAARSRELGTQSGLMRYLRDAQSVSDSLFDCFQRSEENLVNGLPYQLQFDGGLPMIVPLSAIDGAILKARNPTHNSAPTPPMMFTGAPPPVHSAHPSMGVGASDPVPVHVELPLLVALCEQHNSLM